MNLRPERSWTAEHQQQLQLLVENIEDYALFLLDTEGRVMSWSNSAERIKGYKFDEIRGRHFSVFYPPEDIERGKPDFEHPHRFRTEGRSLGPRGTLRNAHEGR